MRRRRTRRVRIRVRRRRRTRTKKIGSKRFPLIKIRKLLGRGVSRPYVNKRNRLMLGSGSSNKAAKQKGGFFPIGAALAAAPPIIDLLGKIIR